MNHLFREKAPITPAGWAEIEKEAKRTLRTLLAARRVVDFRGPLGWETSDVELGRADPIASPNGAREVQARLRRIQPLVELRIPFEMTRAELGCRGGRLGASEIENYDAGTVRRHQARSGETEAVETGTADVIHHTAQRS